VWQEYSRSSRHFFMMICADSIACSSLPARSVIRAVRPRSRAPDSGIDGLELSLFSFVLQASRRCKYLPIWHQLRSLPAVSHSRTGLGALANCQSLSSAALRPLAVGHVLTLLTGSNVQPILQVAVHCLTLNYPGTVPVVLEAVLHPQR
jgi:hypothetical protein